MQVLSYRVPAIATRSEYLGRFPDWEAERQQQICKMCKLRDVAQFGGNAVPVGMSSEAFGRIEGFVCCSCGWWRLWGGREDPPGGFDLLTIGGNGELSTCSLGGTSVPLDALCLHLRKRYEDIRFVHPHVVEDIVGKVFKEYYDCSVEMTKRTRDGGKDLVCFNSNHGKFYVEVKNPQSKGKKVDVSVVQRFVGVLYQDRVSSGILVSSTDFTSDAVAAAELANQSYGLIRVSLRTQRDILSWLDVLSNQHLDERISELTTICSRHGFGNLEPLG